jgi:hypothetical protein
LRVGPGGRSRGNSRQAYTPHRRLRNQGCARRRFTSLARRNLIERSDRGTFLARCWRGSLGATAGPRLGSERACGLSAEVQIEPVPERERRALVVLVVSDDPISQRSPPDRIRRALGPPRHALRATWIGVPPAEPDPHRGAWGSPVPGGRPFKTGRERIFAVGSAPDCSFCVYLILYPALTDTRPLTFRVDYGDGHRDVLRGMEPPTRGRLELRRRGIFHFTEPPSLANVPFTQTWHQYPDADAKYDVRVAVEAMNPDGSRVTLVTLKRRVRIEARGLVSTDASITVPTPSVDAR